MALSSMSRRIIDGCCAAAPLLLALLFFPPAVALAQTPQERPSEVPPTAAMPTADATAQTAADAEQPARTWVVACAGPKDGQASRCQLVATVVMAEQNRHLLTVRMLRQPETGSRGLVFQVPHGTALPAGLDWQVDDGAAQQLVFQVSDAAGVYAGVSVGDDLLATLRGGSVLRVSYVDRANTEAVTITLPLPQFGDASAEFFAAERANRDDARGENE